MVKHNHTSQTYKGTELNSYSSVSYQIIIQCNEDWSSHANCVKLSGGL